ncbi:hypothetical protein [Rhodanobacter lindaniclasticus]
MNRRTRFAVALFAACTVPAFPQAGPQDVPLVRGPRFGPGWQAPRLPTQREVGEWTGLHNFGQVYAARERLMAGIGRACQRRGVAACRS